MCHKHCLIIIFLKNLTNTSEYFRMLKNFGMNNVAKYSKNKYCMYSIILIRQRYRFILQMLTTLRFWDTEIPQLALLVTYFLGLHGCMVSAHTPKFFCRIPYSVVSYSVKNSFNWIEQEILQKTLVSKSKFLLVHQKYLYYTSDFGSSYYT